MDTMTLNWFWFALVLVAAGYVLLGLRHQAHGGSDPATGNPVRPPRGGGGRCGAPVSTPHRGAATVVDPVSGRAVCTSTAPAYFYRGRIYFFASVRSRERFEAAPRAYVQPRHDGGGSPDSTSDETGHAQPARSRRTSPVGGPARSGGEDCPGSPDPRKPKQQGAFDGG